MSLIRKNTLPKGTYLMTDDNKSKYPSGFNVSEKPHIFDAELKENNVIFQGSEFASYETNTENVNNFRSYLTLNLIGGAPSENTILVHKEFRKKGVYRIPIQFGLYDSSYNSTEAAPNDRYVAFNVGVFTTINDIQSAFDIGSLSSGLNAVTRLSVLLKRGGLNNVQVVGTSYIARDQYNEVDNDFTPLAGTVLPDSGGTFYDLGQVLGLSLLVDCTNNRLCVESNLNNQYNVSPWISTKNTLLGDDVVLNHHLYLSLSSPTNTIGNVVIANQTLNDELDFFIAESDVKANGLFMQNSPTYIIKK